MRLRSHQLSISVSAEYASCVVDIENYKNELVRVSDAVLDGELDGTADASKITAVFGKFCAIFLDAFTAVLRFIQGII